MAIDVKAEIVINRSIEDVTSYAMNPDNDLETLKNLLQSGAEKS